MRKRRGTRAGIEDEKERKETQRRKEEGGRRKRDIEKRGKEGEQGPI